MATHMHVAGPALIALGAGNTGLSFLGYSREGVNVTEEMMDVPAMADWAGPGVPADIMIAGKTLRASMLLVDYDPAILNIALARLAGGTLGGLAPNEIGSLINAENRGLHLMVKSQRQPLVPAYSGNLPGFNVPFCFVRGPWSYEIATRPQAVPLTFFATPVIDKRTLASTLWTTDVAGFPPTT